MTTKTLRQGGSALALAALMAAAASFAPAGPALATGYDRPSCPYQPAQGRTIALFSGRLLSTGTVESAPAFVTLPAGSYKVTLFSHDGYAGREGVSQQYEQWVVKFKDGQTVVATSNAVSDIPDNVASATRNETVNQSLALTQGVNAVTAFHAYPGAANYNSVNPVCAAFDRIESQQQLAASCSASASSVPAGQSVTFSASATGGNGSYAYSWTGTDGLSGTGSSATKAYSSAGAKSATVTVTSGGQSATATCSTAVAAPQQEQALAVSCSADPSRTYVGEPVTWRANVSGGTGHYTYHWENSQSFFGSSWTSVMSYATPGTKTATVTVTSGGQSLTRSCSVQIDQYVPANDLSGSCSASRSEIERGESVTWKATASGGTGTYSYEWTGTDSLSATSKSITKAYNSEGTKQAWVLIKSGNQSIVRSCAMEVVDEDDGADELRGSCEADPETARVGDEVVWRAKASGGDGSYKYDWSGSEDLDGSSKTVRKEYETAGTKRATVTIRSDGASVKKSCTVDVEPRRNTATPVVTVYSTPDNPTYGNPPVGTNASGVYLSQVPYTGPMDDLKFALYALAFLLWSGGATYYILKKKYGIDSPLAYAAAKAGEARDELSAAIAGLRDLRVRRKESRVEPAEPDVPQWEKVRHLFQR